MKTVAIIQARLGSTRFPGKVMYPLGDYPALVQMIRRLSFCKTLDEICVAIPDTDANSVIIDTVRQYSVTLYPNISLSFHRGSEQDVLSRVTEAAKIRGADKIVDLTGDCPLVDPAHVDLLVEKTVGPVVFSSNIFSLRTWPDGFDVQVYPFRLLLQLHQVIHQEDSAREHTGYHIPRLFPQLSYFNYLAPISLFCSGTPLDHWGLTLDTPADGILLDLIFHEFRDRPAFSAQDVILYLHSRPELLRINRKVTRKTPVEVML